MLDARLRTLIDPPLDRLARGLEASGLSANAITVTGFVIGCAGVTAIAVQAYALGLVLILLNRLFDGLDGAVARRQGLTDLGGFLDIVLDFVFYALVPLGFALADPARNGAAATFLVASFIGTGSSFLAFASIAAKRGLETEIRGRKSLYYLGGLTEGFETILCFVLMCLLPSAFPVIALAFGTLCWITTATRIGLARTSFRG